jgi:hypothetical protein
MISSKQSIIPKEGICSTIEDLSLADLLKQSSNATGTSSVVNTTTTTAVQPLQIDPSSILSEGELVAKLTNLEKMQHYNEIEDENSDNKQFVNIKKDEDNEINSSQNQQSTLSNNIHSQMINTDFIQDEIKEDNEINSRNSNITQTMIKHFGQNSNNEDKSSDTNFHNNIVLDHVTENTANASLGIEKSKEKLNKRSTVRITYHILFV